jgi:hypothetical protein
MVRSGCFACILRNLGVDSRQIKTPNSKIESRSNHEAPQGCEQRRFLKRAGRVFQGGRKGLGFLSDEDVATYDDAYTPFFGGPELQLVPGAAVAPAKVERYKRLFGSQTNTRFRSILSLQAATSVMAGLRPAFRDRSLLT